MIESIAIIVTESGLAVGCVKIYLSLSIIHKKYLNKWFLDNLSVEHVIITERLNNSVLLDHQWPAFPWSFTVIISDMFPITI
jgi:hypothetical protein